MDFEGMPEEKRRALLESLAAAHSGASARAAGVLAGPATPDRPDVPIWEYRRHVSEHPEVDLADLIAVRFPMLFHGTDEFTITSAEEELEPAPIAAPNPVTLDQVLGMWEHLHDAGVVRWDSERRLVELIRPMDDYAAAIADWWAGAQCDSS
ncbi:hypothetical protein [Herbiconiux sp. L3-i23]|uniref:hypothetical protein n=1 Tax=Herbiconiux sp. L3-i23 TaxID=2905871 RepID=UPI0020625316|nr:hypothetical protein [Herbiconiux sp. L3-i23]BDI23095.1 hypothetical protein L3i23_18710 [Herbiconiux sp. L3-i23]